MLINLKGLLDQRKMKYRAFFELLGMNERTGQSKLYEEYDFSLGEARKIMTIFPEYTLDYLFASDGQKRVRKSKSTNTAESVTESTAI